MSYQQDKSFSWLIYISLFVSLLLTLLPSSDSLSKFLPNWVLLAVLFWSINRPDIMGLSLAWFIGLLQDILVSSFLGQHAFIYLILVFIIVSNEAKLKNFTFFEYLPVVLTLIILENALVLFINYFLDHQPIQFSSFYTVIGALLVWPWLFMLSSVFKVIASDSQQ